MVGEIDTAVRALPKMEQHCFGNERPRAGNPHGRFVLANRVLAAKEGWQIIHRGVHDQVVRAGSSEIYKKQRSIVK